MKNTINSYIKNFNHDNRLELFNDAYSTNFSLDAIRRNIVAFNIFFSDLNFYSIYDSPQINFVLLFANLAGICGGSFLGISLFAVFEFLEFILVSFFLISKLFFCNIFQKNNKITT